MEFRSRIDRIQHDMESIAKITSTPGMGYTRFSYSKEDAQARAYLLNEMERLGLEIKIDGVGNIRAKYVEDNANRPSIMFGSHIDTVANGGKFDGLTGVVSALEAIRVIKESKIKLKNPLELVIFAEEEGSNFGITMFGSKVFTGKYGVENLRKIKNDKGVSSLKILQDFGLNVENIGSDILKKNEAKAMIELHVEQGGILDSKKIPIGIVNAIVGMRTYKVSLKGISNHAGTTPMNLRKDPMVGTAEIIFHLEKVVKEDPLFSTVATIGRIHCKPNMHNVIPEENYFYTDIRDVDMNRIKDIANELKRKTEEVALKRGLKAKIDLVGKSDSVQLSRKIIGAIEKTALEKGYNYKIMNSGAVHDAAMLTDLTEVGMIFVPSINGKSHCKEEKTNLKDIKLGCDLLLNTVIHLANE